MCFHMYCVCMCLCCMCAHTCKIRKVSGGEALPSKVLASAKGLRQKRVGRWEGPGDCMGRGGGGGKGSIREACISPVPTDWTSHSNPRTKAQTCDCFFMGIHLIFLLSSVLMCLNFRTCNH